MFIMALHDRRLVGPSPRGYDRLATVDGGIPLATALSRVQYEGRQRFLTALHVMCHGLAARADVGQGVSTTERHGGFGLELCREHLTLANVARTHAWRNLIGQIVLFSCGAAATSGHNAGTIGDGRRFCGELALWTGAEVIAARDVQAFSTYEDTFWNSIRAGSPHIDFGAWEGPVFRFTPAHPEGIAFTPRPYDPLRPGVF